MSGGLTVETSAFLCRQNAETTNGIIVRFVARASRARVLGSGVMQSSL
jgi:hypothetical protein